MTTAVASEVLTGQDERTRGVAIAPAVAVAAFTSIGAGAIHAAAIGVHSEHRQTAITFTILAFLQLAWGVAALMRSSKLVLAAGVLLNLAAVGGWILAKTSGISFIDGLEPSEGPQRADTTAMVLAAIAVIACILALTVKRFAMPNFSQLALTGAALATAVVTMFGMLAAGSHAHAAGGHHGGDTAAAADGHEHAAGTPEGGGGGEHTAAVVPPKPYDPDKPIDLGGIEGVTPEQQARAENLVALTVMRLPQWDDMAKVEAAGFVSIGDGGTGTEHYVNVGYFDDGRILDPDYPESLVYDTFGPGPKRLAAAMYMLAPDKTLDQVPDVGGKLTQWHIHNNLCFTSSGQVGGIRPNGGECPSGLNKGSEAPMLHVWIRPDACGPFAALEGIGGGQIKEGETKLCDHAHGA